MRKRSIRLQRCRKEAGFSPHWGDWWMGWGFLHSTNWIHRSLDKVHEWDGYGLKTERRGGAVQERWYRWGCSVLPQWRPSSSSSSAVAQTERAERGIDNARERGKIGGRRRRRRGMSTQEMVGCAYDRDGIHSDWTAAKSWFPSPYTLYLLRQLQVEEWITA